MRVGDRFYRSPIAATDSVTTDADPGFPGSKEP
jgi:hypothetical protein